jgi:hypothetical protein
MCCGRRKKFKEKENGKEYDNQKHARQGSNLESLAPKAHALFIEHI